LSRRVALACMLCSAMLGGCTGARAPVAEHGVADYRRAAKPAAVPAGGSAAAKPVPTKTPAAIFAAPSSAPASAAKARAAAKEVADEDARPAAYTVKRGDTLYSIALDNGLAYRELAAWNQISDPNVIKVGQALKLRAPPGWKPDSAGADEVVTQPLMSTASPEGQPLDMPVPTMSQPKGIKVPYSEAALTQLTRFPDRPPVASAPALPVEAKPSGTAPSPAQAPSSTQVAKVESTPPPAALPPPKPEPAVREGAIQWVWPASGKLLHTFNQGPNPKGVAIGGASGEPVVASATGKVVYSGSGLRGYGKLIIIKHDDTYLSVYAHNRELLVKEGERVSRGQRIAEMGGTGSQQAELHFEIRRFGKPVDPLKLLPPEGPS